MGPLARNGCGAAPVGEPPASPAVRRSAREWDERIEARLAVLLRNARATSMTGHVVLDIEFIEGGIDHAQAGYHADL